MDLTNNIYSSLIRGDKLLLVPLFEDASFTTVGPRELKALLEKREKEKDFRGRAGENLLLFPDDRNLPKKILLVGFGKKKKLNAHAARSNAALAVKAAKPHKIQEISFFLPESMVKFAWQLSEGFGLGNYNPAKYQTGRNKERHEKHDIKRINIIRYKRGGNLGRNVIEGMEVAKAVNEVRDLVNAPPALKTVDYLAKKAQEISRKNGYKIRIFDKKELEKIGMGAIAGVNRGSAAGAKMVIMEYRPWKARKKPPIVVAGKGIIFDSGGYNLKPSQGLKEMNLDMAGAGAVLGLFMLLKRLDVPHHVVGIFPLTENLIGPTAQKPSDIVTTYSGKTVEVTNTDAEGRLILADALSYAVRHLKPRYLIDLATLTGACVVALGERYAGLFGNDKGLMEKLRRAGKQTDELAWPMPIHPDYTAKMKSNIADLRNWDETPNAGACKGAAFLQYFVEKTPWAHIDIAGPAYAKEPKKYESPMGTGFGVRLLLRFLSDL